MGKSAKILALDVILWVAVLELFRTEKWTDIYRMSFNQSRTGLIFFRGAVLRGMVIFVTLYLIVSLLTFIVRRLNNLVSENDQNRALIAKYVAFLLTVLVSPYFYFRLWLSGQHFFGIVAGGCALSIVLFSMVAALTYWLGSRPNAQHQPAAV